MKKFLAMILACLSVAAFAGCDGTGDSTVTADEFANGGSEESVIEETVQYSLDISDFENVTLKIYEKKKDEKGVLRVYNHSYMITPDSVWQVVAHDIGMSVSVKLNEDAIEKIWKEYLFFVENTIPDLTYDEQKSTFSLKEGATFSPYPERTYTELSLKIVNGKITYLEGKFGVGLLKITFENYGTTM